MRISRIPRAFSHANSRAPSNLGIGLLCSWLLVVGISGCKLREYRRSADVETYGVIAEKTADARWTTPIRPLEPPPESRHADPYDPDRPPMPPDDPAAHPAMHFPGGMKGESGWHERGDAPWIENPQWRIHLETSDTGQVELSRDRALELALLNSRDYQFELENLYFAALALTLDRFEFQLQWFGGNLTEYFHFGHDGTPGGETNTLTTITNLGFTRAFAAGGQLLVNLANTYVWEFTGANSVAVHSNLAINFVQPLLRGAGRNVRLEGLTQAERNVLYAARDFTRFRKQFYFDVVAGNGGYLSLLLQLQNIRNLEANLSSLEQDLRAHEALFAGGIVSRIQVDQVFQVYQTGRLALIQARNAFETQLDAYKILLGLPPDIPVAVDDSLLEPFQLTDPALDALEAEIQRFLAIYREMAAAPPLDDLRQAYEKLESFQSRLAGFYEQLVRELERWKAEPPAPGEDDQLGGDREAAVQQQIEQRLEQLRKDLATLGQTIAEQSAGLREEDRDLLWQALRRLTRRQLSIVSQLFVMQTQVRAYLVDLQPIPYETESAAPLALARRLDLMNEQARVVDQWRRIQLAQNALEADLDVFVGADIGTTPGTANPVKFSAAGTSYRAGFRFDSPLNRKAERNIYRAQLIQYQRARRSYMELQDRVMQDVRQDLRELQASRLNFEIARQSLIIAASQVEFARDQLLDPEPGGDSSRTQDTLNALNSLLDAKNNLIAIWIDYETSRLQLLLDVEALQLDPSQEPTDEYDNPQHRPPDVEELPAPAGIDGRAEPVADQGVVPASLQHDAFSGGRHSSRRTRRLDSAAGMVHQR